MWWSEHHEWRWTDRILDLWGKGDMDIDDVSEEEARERWPDAF